MIKVSVIVPVYNTSKYLSKCIDSLINQTLEDIEIIIINDCSPDNSKLILDKYKNIKKINIIHNKVNKGIGYTRNLGLKKAKGEYIAFIDSDDFVDINMFEKMYKKAKKDDLDLVVCRFHKLLEKQNGVLEEINPNFTIPYFKNTSLKDCPKLLLEINSAPWNKLYKRSLFSKDVRFPENLKYEDAIVCVKILAKAKKIGMVEDKFNYYLVRDKSESTAMDIRVFDIIEINNQKLQFLKKLDYYDSIKEYVEIKIIRSLTNYIKQQKYQKDKIIANNFKQKAIDYLNSNFPNWKRIKNI